MGIDILSALASSAGLALIAGALLAVAFVLITPLKTWFIAQNADAQAAIMAWLIIALAAVAIITSCAGVLSVITCTRGGILEYIGQVLYVALAGIAGNRAVFQLARARSNGRASMKELEAPAIRSGKLLER